jgi:hypothetical protein
MILTNSPAAAVHAGAVAPRERWTIGPSPSPRPVRLTSIVQQVLRHRSGPSFSPGQLPLYPCLVEASTNEPATPAASYCTPSLHPWRLANLLARPPSQTLLTLTLTMAEQPDTCLRGVRRRSFFHIFLRRRFLGTRGRRCRCTSMEDNFYGEL